MNECRSNRVINLSNEVVNLSIFKLATTSLDMHSD